MQNFGDILWMSIKKYYKMTAFPLTIVMRLKRFFFFIFFLLQYVMAMDFGYIY